MYATYGLPLTINIPQMLASIYHTWILWVILVMDILRLTKSQPGPSRAGSGVSATAPFFLSLCDLRKSGGVWDGRPGILGSAGRNIRQIHVNPCKSPHFCGNYGVCTWYLCI